MSKKILALLLALCLCLSLGAAAFAAEGESVYTEEEKAIASMVTGGTNMSSNAAAAYIAVSADGVSGTETGFEAAAAGEGESVIDDTHAENIVITGVSSGASAGLTVTGGAEYTFGGEEELVEITYPTFLNETETGLFNSAIILNDDGSQNAASVDEGTLYIQNAYMEVAGARRMTVAAHDTATLILNDSVVVSTGGTEGSVDTNQKLLVGGITRTNFSEGATTTYYFNSKCITDGWAAMSTDSAKNPGLWFYSYNSDGISYWGGYGTYADTSCHDYFYASRLYGEDMAVIISNNGEVYAYAGSDTPDDVLQYNTGATSDAGSEFWGGRNCFEIHAPNMNHASNNPGSAKSQKTALVVIKDSLVGVDKDLENTVDGLDFAEKYGEAYGEYVDFIDGAVFLIKSTCVDITLDNAEVVSPNGIIMMTVVNNDDTPYTLASGDVAEGKQDLLKLTNGTYEGDVLHYDYMRPVVIEITDAEWTGTAETWDYDTWQAYWEPYADDANCTWYIPDFAGYESVGTTVNVNAGGVWNVTAECVLEALNVAEGGTVNGIITENADGTVTVSPEEGAAAADKKDEGVPAGESAEGSLFDAFIEYMRGQLISDGENNDDFAALLDAATEETYDETAMPFEMFISMGALGYEDFCAYYEANGAAPAGTGF